MYRIEIHMAGSETILLTSQTSEQVKEFTRLYHADSIAPLHPRRDGLVLGV